MKGLNEPIPPIFADYTLRTAPEECQAVNPIFYLKSSPCPHAGCCTCHSVQRWRGEDWRMFWDGLQSLNQNTIKRNQ